MDADGDASVAEAKAGASEDVEPGEQQRAPSSTNLQARAAPKFAQPRRRRPRAPG